MKRLFYFIAVLAIAGLSFQSCSGKKQTENTDIQSPDKKILVCYFSATGTTEKAAQRIADLTGGVLHNIAPETAYTDTDLDWRDSLSRSYEEMHNRDSRPALKDSVPLSFYRH